MSFDPELLPGAVRAELEELDRLIALVEGNVLEGRCRSMDEISSMLGERRGLIKARAVKLKRLDDDQKRRLGLAP